MIRGGAGPAAAGAVAVFAIFAAMKAVAVMAVMWPAPGAGASLGLLADPGEEYGVVGFRAVDVIVARYGEKPGELGLSRMDDGMLLGISTFCVARDGTVLLADPARREILAYRGTREPSMAFPYPRGARVIKLEATAERVFALCGVDRADRSDAAAPRWNGGASRAADAEGLHLMTRRWRGGGWTRSIDVGALLKRGLVSRGEGDAPWRMWLVRSAKEIYLYDPRSGLSHRLTQDGEPLPAGCARIETVEGWALPCGARAVKLDEGISLLRGSGSRRDMPWLAGSLIGGDAEGRLYVCEIENGLDKPEVCVAVYEGSAEPVAKWRLPGRPGAVRMRGPRIIVSDDGCVYEFWSSLSELHIVRWEAPVEAADTGSFRNR